MPFNLKLVNREILFKQSSYVRRLWCNVLCIQLILQLSKIFETYLKITK